MNSREFCYWLQGHFEISGGGELTQKQVGLIRKHLNMVFKHEIDPSYEDSEVLNQIHNPPVPSSMPAPLPPSLSSHSPFGNDELIRC